MTTGKRHIPINSNGAPASAAPAGAAPATHDHSHAAGKGRSGAPVASGPGVTAAQVDLLTAERDALVAERDALVAENDALIAERDALTVERDALSDQLLRLRAEFDNFRKRVSRDSLESYSRTQCEVLNDFLPILDNLERALDAAEHHEEGKVLDGVRMTRDMFVGLLARAGVEEIAGEGSPFDPQVHDAVVVQPSSYEEGQVAAVVERGYRQGDRILRPARVVVSAGKAASAVVDGAAATGSSGASASR